MDILWVKSPCPQLKTRLVLTRCIEKKLTGELELYSTDILCTWTPERPYDAVAPDHLLCLKSTIGRTSIESHGLFVSHDRLEMAL